MAKVVERQDDFQTRREHIKNMSDAELKARFWELADKLVDPLLDLAKDNTSASVERSILLRMGLSSIEAQAVIDGVVDRGLLKYGAGHVVYIVAKDKGIDARQAGQELIEGSHWDFVVDYFS
jgi:D-ornithine 4,5-aminomutase subunit alpha